MVRGRKYCVNEMVDQHTTDPEGNLENIELTCGRYEGGGDSCISEDQTRAGDEGKEREYRRENLGVKENQEEARLRGVTSVARIWTFLSW